MRLPDQMASREYEAKYRQQGRAAKHIAMIMGDTRETSENLKALRRRVAHKGATYQRMVELGLLEKELEARRCRACDQLRAQAWGMGQPGWLQRKCGRCWAQQAEQSSTDRHSCQPQGSSDETGSPASRPVTARDLTLALAALSNRDPEALLDALGGRAVALMMQQHPAAARARAPEPRPVMEELSTESYYHDEILKSLSHQTPPSSSATVSPDTEASAPPQPASNVQSTQQPAVTGLHIADPTHTKDGAEQHRRSSSSSSQPAASHPPFTQHTSSPASQRATTKHSTHGRAAVTAHGQGLSTVATHGRSDGPAPDQHVELRQALADAERLLVFGSSQEIRTEALFHASQLRQAMADLKRYDRREAAAGAIYQYRALQDPRDANGIRQKSMSKQAAAFQVAAKAALSRQPAARKHQTTLPSRRSGVPDNQIFTIVHPDWDSQPWTEPGITWRPSAATSRSKPPRDNITSAGDYVAYDYHKELAKVRSMRVDDLKAFLRQEKRWQAELQQLSLAALSSPSGVGEVLPSFEACRGLP